MPTFAGSDCGQWHFPVNSMLFLPKSVRIPVRSSRIWALPTFAGSDCGQWHFPVNSMLFLTKSVKIPVRSSQAVAFRPALREQQAVAKRQFPVRGTP